VEVAVKMLLLPLKNVVELLGQWARGWLSPALCFFWLRNGALRIGIDDKGVELVNLYEEQLGSCSSLFRISEPVVTTRAVV
jgi:hypothetical protein